MSYPGFYADELKAALKEQGSAIRTFTFLGSTDDTAEATVTLLEDRAVHIVLSERGYGEKPNQSNAVAKRYDTLDGLLRSLSPLYEQEQHRQLFASLEKLAAERNVEEQEN